MEESLNTTPTTELPRDISEEQYRGPSASAAGFGEGFKRHFIRGLVGLGLGASLAYVFHGTAAKVIQKSRNLAENLTEQGETKGAMAWCKRRAGDLLFGLFGEGEGVTCVNIQPHNVRHDKWIKKTLASKQHGFGYWFSGHVLGNLPVINLINKPLLKASEEKNLRFANAVTIGGIGAAAGYINGWASGLFGGGKQSYEGRNQYESLREEHKKLREQYNSLVVDGAANEPLSSHALIGNTGQENGQPKMGNALPTLAPSADNDNEISTAPVARHATLPAQSAENDNELTQPAAKHHMAQPAAHHESKPTVDAASIAHQGMQHAHAHHAAAH